MSISDLLPTDALLWYVLSSGYKSVQFLSRCQIMLLEVAGAGVRETGGRGFSPPPTALHLMGGDEASAYLCSGVGLLLLQ